MMKKYLSTLKSAGFFAAFLISSWWSTAQAQNCDISGPSEGCQDAATTFTVNSQPGDVINWTSSTGQSAIGGSAQLTFTTPGPVTITVTINRPGGGTCTQNFSFTVNAKPTANFVLQSKPSQCYTGNQFSFRDLSTPGAGRSLTTAEFLFGDGAQDFSTGPGGTFTHSYPGRGGGYYSPFLRVINDKGCVSDASITNAIYVTKDIGADFSTTGTRNCGTSRYPITNLSTIDYPNVKYFRWDFGDGKVHEMDTNTARDIDEFCYWDPVHVYSKHGFFDVTLIIQDDSNCWDTMEKKQFASNVNPDLKIVESNGKDAQCHAGNLMIFTHDIDPYGWPYSFLWDFGDPDAQNLNFDNQNFKNAPHTFTKPDVFTVTITGQIAGCPFNSTADVFLKGPSASIEDKKIPDLVAEHERHQCQIRDTVHFVNNSKFAFNDQFILDDRFGATTLLENGLVLIDYHDSVFYYNSAFELFYWGSDTFAVVLEDSAKSSEIKHELIMYNNFFGIYAGGRENDHLKMVWDFGDQTAPQCTTWTKHMQNVWDTTQRVFKFRRVIDRTQFIHLTHKNTTGTSYDDLFNNPTAYANFLDDMRLTQVGNLFKTDWDTFTYEFVESGAPWMNCNFSRDPKPKHWYSPGEEDCYVVRLTIEDTSYQNPNHGFQYYDVMEVDTAGDRLVLSVIDTAQFIKYGWHKYPQLDEYYFRAGGVFNADTMRLVPYAEYDTVWRYPYLLDGAGNIQLVYNPDCQFEVIDTLFDVDKSKRVFERVDEIPNKWYINPNVSNGNVCLAEGTMMLPLMPPNADGLQIKPYRSVFCLGTNPTYGVTFDWSETKPGCSQEHVWINFDSLADRLDNTPGVLDRWSPQATFLLDPMTPWPMGTSSLPQWPTSIYYDYTGRLADSCGNITVGLRIQNGYDPVTDQPCIDEKWYHKALKYINSEPSFEIDTVYGCGPLEVELEFIREFHDSLEYLSTNVNVDFTLDNDYSKGYTYVDSIYRNKYDPITGTYINYVLTFYFDRTGIPVKVDSMVWTPGVGGVEGCGSELKIKTKRKFIFTDPARYAIISTARTLDGCNNNSRVKYVVIGNAKHTEANKSLICKNDYVEFIDTALYMLLEPDPFTGAQFVGYNYWRGTNASRNPDGSARNIAQQNRERVRWDFGQGDGFITFNNNQNPHFVRYDIPGHYKILTEFKDSAGCLDTLELRLDVTGGKANFNYNVNVGGDCKPIVNFFDQSVVYDPCRLTYGYACDSVVRWIWDYGDGSPVTDTDVDNPVSPPIKNPSHVYQRFGDFDVRLIVQTRMGCWDTIVSTVTISGPRPRFDFTIDSIGCAPYTVYLGNFTQEPTSTSRWTWFFGDGTSYTTESDTVVYYTYMNPGQYKIVLEQEDFVPLTGGRCRDSFPGYPREVVVTVLPPKNVDFIPSKLEVCPNEIVTFTDTSDAVYTNFVWDFGDSTGVLDTTGKVVTHAFKNPGDYVVRLFPDYTPAPGEPKCRQSKAILIRVRDVEADFTVDSSAMPIFSFTNTSTNAVQYWWDFGVGQGFIPCPAADPSNCPNAQYNYEDRVDTFRVCLIALSPEGCYDTTCQTVFNSFETSIDIPNVFTPNGDGANDVFNVQINGWTKYNIQVFNRFSDKVFESDDPNNPWNGKLNNSGADLPAGVYYVVITYTLRGGVEQTYNGTITLIR